MKSVWIQRHDFDITDFGSIPIDEALMKIETFDWESERRAETDGFEKSENTAIPKIVFEGDDGSELHLFPSEASFEAHLHCKVPSTILWVFPSVKWASHRVHSVPSEELKSLLGAFYESEHKEVFTLLEQFGTPF